MLFFSLNLTAENVMANKSEPRNIIRLCRDLLSRTFAIGDEVLGVLPNQIPETKRNPIWPKKSDYTRSRSIAVQRTATLEVLKLINIYMDSNMTEVETRIAHAERIVEYAEKLEKEYPKASREFIARYSVTGQFGFRRLHFHWQEDPQVMANLATYWAIREAKKISQIVPKLRADYLKVEFSYVSVGSLQIADGGSLHPDAVAYDVNATIICQMIKTLDPDLDERKGFSPSWLP